MPVVALAAIATDGLPTIPIILLLSSDMARGALDNYAAHRGIADFSWAASLWAEIALLVAAIASPAAGGRADGDRGPDRGRRDAAELRALPEGSRGGRRARPSQRRRRRAPPRTPLSALLPAAPALLARVDHVRDPLERQVDAPVAAPAAAPARRPRSPSSIACSTRCGERRRRGRTGRPPRTPRCDSEVKFVEPMSTHSPSPDDRLAVDHARVEDDAQVVGAARPPQDLRRRWRRFRSRGRWRAPRSASSPTRRA